MIEFNKVTKNIGAEVTGIDLSKPLDEEQVEIVRKGLLEHLVLFFREQDITDEQHQAFALNFGTLDIPAMNRDGGAIHVLDQTDPKGEGGDQWHSDNTFMKIPPMGSLLRAVMLPEVGKYLLTAHEAGELRRQIVTRGGAGSLPRRRVRCVGRPLIVRQRSKRGDPATRRNAGLSPPQAAVACTGIPHRRILPPLDTPAPAHGRIRPRPADARSHAAPDELIARSRTRRRCARDVVPCDRHHRPCGRAAVSWASPGRSRRPVT